MCLARCFFTQRSINSSSKWNDSTIIVRIRRDPIADKFHAMMTMHEAFVIKHNDG